MSVLVPDHAIIRRTAHRAWPTRIGRTGDPHPRDPVIVYIWRHVVPELVATGYGVYIFDLLGFGESERPWDVAVDTSVTGQVKVLTGLMGLWRISAAHIVAHDIGGGIAQRLACSNAPGFDRRL